MVLCTYSSIIILLGWVGFQWLRFVNASGSTLNVACVAILINA